MRRLVLLLAAVVAALVVLMALAWTQTQLVPVGRLARDVPGRTALMRERENQARAKGRSYSIDQRWVPYSRVSPLLRRAVLVAEDDAFFAHGGLDWNEIQAAARKNLEEHRIVRGGSTITQQLAKNLFTGDARNPLRKFKELFLALRLEGALSKRRIFELYLNLIEWGDGIYGAEAAARRYFGVPASQLNERQSLLLAAIIINPRKYSALHPNRRIEKRVRMIAGRLLHRGYLNRDQYQVAIGAPPPVASRGGFMGWFFGAPADTTRKAPAPEPAPSPTSADTAAPEPAVPDTGAPH